MRSVAALALAAALLASGCVVPVFNEPISLSTRSVAAARARSLGKRVAATTSDFFFVLIPVPSDPRDLYDDLLEEAERAGGNAVIDVQVRNRSTVAWLFPPIVAVTTEATGTAAVVE